MMKKWIMAVLLVFSCGGALAVEVAGVQLEEAIKVGGKDLNLNGTGVRSAMSVKIYVAGLYLREKNKDADAVIASKDPKRLVLVFKRNLKSSIVLAAFRDGIRLNADPADLEKLAPRISQLERALNALEEARSGDKLALDFPMDGSVDIIYNDKLVESIPGPDMGSAMLKIWLGYVPVADDLKNGLLAGASYGPKAPKRSSAFDSIFDGFSP